MAKQTWWVFKHKSPGVSPGCEFIPYLFETRKEARKYKQESGNINNEGWPDLWKNWKLIKVDIVEKEEVKNVGFEE